MTNWESIDPDKVKKIFARSFATDKRTHAIRLCNVTDCADCLFHEFDNCKKAKDEWLDQPVLDPETDIDWKRVPIDTPVIVWNSEFVANRYFCQKINSTCFETFIKGSTSWSSSSSEIYNKKEHWPHCKLYRPEDVEKYRKKGSENG